MILLLKSSYKNLGDKQRGFRINIPLVLIVLPSYVGKVVFFWCGVMVVVEG
jgi:hypothetical protein